MHRLIGINTGFNPPTNLGPNELKTKHNTVEGDNLFHERITLVFSVLFTFF